MLTVRTQRTIDLITDSEGRPIQYIEIDVSTADELPADGVIYGVKARHGSIAHGVRTGELWSWDGAAEAWYNQDGSDAPQPNTLSTTQAAPQLNLSQNISPSLDRAQFTDIEPAKEVTEDESVRGTESEQSAEIS